MMQKQQLEFGINPVSQACRGVADPRGFTRSDWWFLQMRLAVERAQIPVSEGPHRSLRSHPPLVADSVGETA